MTEEETMDAGALRELAGPIRAAITNAYYDARNEGWSMETAADNAQAAVLSLLAAAREPVAPAEAEGCQHPVWDGPYRMTCGRQLVNGECGRHGRQAALAQPPAPVSAETAWDELKAQLDAWAEHRLPGGDTAINRKVASILVDSNRPAIEAAIRGTSETGLDVERLARAIFGANHYPDTAKWRRTFRHDAEAIAAEYVRLSALRGQPSETPAAGDGETGV